MLVTSHHKPIMSMRQNPPCKYENISCCLPISSCFLIWWVWGGTWQFAFPTGDAALLGSTTFEFGTDWWGGFHSTCPESLGRGSHWRFQKHVGHAQQHLPIQGLLWRQNSMSAGKTWHWIRLLSSDLLSCEPSLSQPRSCSQQSLLI